MPRKRYTARQIQMLERVHKAHIQRSRNRADLEERIRAEATKQLMADEVAESLAANEALAEGVTGSDIRKALAIANWDRYKAVLAMTAAQMVEADPVHIDPWTVNLGADGLPESVTLHEYKAKSGGTMVVSDLVLPGKVDAIDGRFYPSGWALAETVDWDWITALERVITKNLGQVAEPKSPTLDATGRVVQATQAVPLDLPPEDDYFTPRWDPSMDLEDEDA